MSLSYIAGPIAAFNTNKYYLEQQLIPMQVYMDDIDAFMAHLTPKQICKLNTIERDYRINMRIDSYVRVKVDTNKYLLFENKRMVFVPTSILTERIHSLIQTPFNESVPVVICLTPRDKPMLQGHIQFTIAEYDDTRRTRLTAPSYNNPKDKTRTNKYTLYCHGDDGAELWFRNYKTLNEIYSDLRPLQLCKGLRRVYIQTYDTTLDDRKFTDFLATSSENIYKWVDAACIYRGVYRPLSPIRCNLIKTCKIDSRKLNNDGWNTGALTAVVKAWNNLEYLYLALKSMFEEIRTLRTLQVEDDVEALRDKITQLKKSLAPEAMPADFYSETPQNSKFKTYVLQ